MKSILASFTLVLLSTSVNVAAEDVVGPVVGTVESTTAHILYRPAAAASNLKLTVLSEDGTVVAIRQAKGEARNDFVARFEVGGLQPDTAYEYQIESIDERRILIEPGRKHSFTTGNANRKDHKVTVSFVSCVDVEPNGIWKDMQKQAIDTLFLMGDTPYIDDSDLAVVRSKHRAFLQMPELAALAKTTPTVGVWDDHDFGKNNGNGRNMMTGKLNTRKGFVDYRAHNQYGNGADGVYHKVDLGMIEVFLLDPRYFSQTEPSPVDAAQPTCFGTDQWNWLLQGLQNSEATFKVLAMGGIWQDKKNSETDDMFTYWYERDALLDFVKNQKISGVVLLGGDIHVARHLVHPQRVGYDLHDFIISPGHTRVITTLDVYHPSLEWSLVEGWQYLTLTADGTSDSPTLTAEYRQPGGVVNRRVSMSLGEMTANSEDSRRPELRASWNFDSDLKNRSVLGSRLHATSVNGAALDQAAGIHGGAVRFDRSQQQYLSVARSFLDDNSASHTVSLWCRPTTLPAHGTRDRAFLFESTAEGTEGSEGAWSLSLGLRATTDPKLVNLQLYAQTLKPADTPEAAPTAISQGPFDTFIRRDEFLSQWNHVVCTFDSRSLTLYLEGKQVAKHVLPVSGPASEFGGLIIGGHRAGQGRNFDGWIDDLRIWQGDLDGESVSALWLDRQVTSQ